MAANEIWGTMAAAHADFEEQAKTLGVVAVTKVPVSSMAHELPSYQLPALDGSRWSEHQWTGLSRVVAQLAHMGARTVDERAKADDVKNDDCQVHSLQSHCEHPVSLRTMDLHAEGPAT
jgi:hypothetical protein